MLKNDKNEIVFKAQVKSKWYSIFWNDLGTNHGIIFRVDYFNTAEKAMEAAKNCLGAIKLGAIKHGEVVVFEKEM